MNWGLIAFVELGLFCVQLVAFAALYGLRSNWGESPTGQALLGFALVVAVSFAGFFALAFIRIPGWVFAAVFAAGNVVMFRMLQLLVRAQRRGG